MNTTLLVFVLLYLIATLAVGAWAGLRIKNTEDFAVAGHSLPLYMVITTSFATWFGAETVMGIPATFVQEGLRGVIEDPFGASMCLVLVGVFFATKLYRMHLITIGDFYRKRFGVKVEIMCSIMIILSYLGWVAAQITALGLVFSILSGGEISHQWGMVIGTVLVLIYVMMGGMLAVAWTDFIQMIVLVIGLSYIAYYSADLVGGSDKVFALARERGWFNILPEAGETTAASIQNWMFYVAAAITMMFGSIPQQDVFQRVMSAKNESAARNGAVIGGLCYLAFAFVPMFIVSAALLAMPEHAPELLANDPQQVLPRMILDHMPLIAQIFFFGALVSAIKSCSSATLLAPSTSFVENILRHLAPSLNDKQLLFAMRLTILIFTASVLTYAILSHGTPIYELVSSAYQVTLVGSFVPLTFGLYWKHSTTQGAILAIIMGVAFWAVIMFGTHLSDVVPALEKIDEKVPAQLIGLIAALVGMIGGSLGPQLIRNDHHEAR
ncbi:MAG: sodium:solute symporter family protein [Pirellulales bacterium]